MRAGSAGRGDAVRLHLTILGVVYSLLGCLSGAFALLVLTVSFVKGERAGAVPFILMGLTLWFLQIGLGLWRRRRGSLVLAALTAAVLLILLNIALLFADAGGFSSSTGQTLLHLSLIALGLYTLAVVLNPRAKAEMI